jgi:hypothetical protein
MRHKLDLGTALQGLGAVLVLIALSVRWYDPGGTAWRVFEVVDLLLAALAAAAIVLAIRRAVTGEPATTPGWVPAISLAVLVVVAAQVIDPPPAARGALRDTGAWLALAGALVMAAGAVLDWARISVTVDVRGRDRRRRVPAVDRRERGAEGREQPPAAERAPWAEGPPAADDEERGSRAEASEERTRPLRRADRDDPDR